MKHHIIRFGYQNKDNCIVLLEQVRILSRHFRSNMCRHFVSQNIYSLFKIFISEKRSIFSISK